MITDKYLIFDLHLLDLPRNSSTHCDSRRGQVTIWVIVAMMFAVSIFILFSFDRGVKIDGSSESDAVFDLQSSLDQCAGQSVEIAVGIILRQGGFIIPENSISYDGNEIGYLCEADGSGVGCVQVYLRLHDNINEEIKSFIYPMLDGCFDNMKREFEDRAGEVDLGSESMELDVEIGPDRVFLFIDKTVSITKQGETRRFNNMKVEVFSPIFDFVNVAMEIASREESNCDFDYGVYSSNSERYEIIMEIDGLTKIYVIEDIDSGYKMNVAIGGCLP